MSEGVAEQPTDVQSPFARFTGGILGAGFGAETDAFTVPKVYPKIRRWCLFCLSRYIKNQQVRGARRATPLLRLVPPIDLGNRFESWFSPVTPGNTVFARLRRIRPAGNDRRDSLREVRRRAERLLESRRTFPALRERRGR